MTSATNSAPPAPQWSQSTRIIVVVLAICLGLLVIWMLKSLWWLIILAGVLAYLLQPLVGLLTRWRLPRGAAAMVVVLLTLALVILVPALLIPALSADISPISIDWNEAAGRFSHWAQSLPEYYTVLSIDIPVQPTIRQIVASINAMDMTTVLPSPQEWLNIAGQALRSATSVVGFATDVAVGLIGLIVAVVFGFFLLFYLTYYGSKDMPALLEAVIGLAPADYRPEWRELWRRTGRVWQAFFRGQIVLSLVVGVAVWVSMTLLGIPGALVLAVIAGVLEVLPNIGPLVAMVPAILLALLEGSSTFPEMSHLLLALLVIVVYFLIQQVENYVLVPRILGGSVGVHPALVVVGVLVGTAQLGIIGAFVAAPVLATTKVWGQYLHARILGVYPYPELYGDSAAQPDVGTPSSGPPTLPIAAIESPPEPEQAAMPILGSEDHVTD